MTAATSPSSRARRTRLSAGLLAAVALAAPLLAGCGDDTDEYDALPPTPDYVAPGPSFCADLMEQLALGERADDWKLTDWRAETAKQQRESASATASPSASASASSSSNALASIEDGVCAFEVSHGTGRERTRSMVALSVIAADDAGVKGLYEHASSQTAAVMELNYDARPTDVPGEWTQSLRAELVPPGRGKVPVDLQDLVLSGNLHANLKAHAGGVARADVEATQAELRWASDQVLGAVVAVLAEEPESD